MAVSSNNSWVDSYLEALVRQSLLCSVRLHPFSCPAFLSEAWFVYIQEMAGNLASSEHHLTSSRGVSCVQLSYGLSSEYSKSPAAEKTDSEKVDADRQLYAKYYVSQIMQMGEEGIRDAWNKASADPMSWPCVAP